MQLEVLKTELNYFLQIVIIPGLVRQGKEFSCQMALGGDIQVENAQDLIVPYQGPLAKMNEFHRIFPFSTSSTLPPVRREISASSQQVIRVWPPPMRLSTNSCRF